MNINLMRKRREELGITQQDLADKCELSRVSISNYESGKTVPDKENLMILANVLDVDPIDLACNEVEEINVDLEDLISKTQYSLFKYLNKLVGQDEDSSFGIKFLEVMENILDAKVVYLPNLGYVALLKSGGNIINCDLNIFKYYITSLINNYKGFNDFNKLFITKSKLINMIYEEVGTDEQIQLNQTDKYYITSLINNYKGFNDFNKLFITKSKLINMIYEEVGTDEQIQLNQTDNVEEIQLNQTDNGGNTMYGMLLRDKRKALGLSQKDLAELCDITENSIYNYENGKSRPTKNNMNTLAKVLNISDSELLVNFTGVTLCEFQNFIDTNEEDLLVRLNNLIAQTDQEDLLNISDSELLVNFTGVTLCEFQNFIDTNEEDLLVRLNNLIAQTDQEDLAKSVLNLFGNVFAECVKEK